MIVMRTALISALMSFAWASSSADVIRGNALVDGEDSTAGTTLSAGILDNMSHQFPPIGTWSIVATTATHLRVSGVDQGLTNSVEVGATQYSGTGTRGIVVESEDPSHYAQLEFGATYDELSFGCWVTPPTAASGDSQDLIEVQPGGGYTIVNWVNIGGTTSFRIHTGAGQSAVINATAGTTYWVTVHAVLNGTCTIKVYTTGLELVGTSTINQPSTSEYQRLRLGRCDGTGTKADSSSNFDDLIIDLEDATFPLLPNTADATRTVLATAWVQEDFEGTGKPVAAIDRKGLQDYDYATTPINGVQSLDLQEGGGDTEGQLAYWLGSESNVYLYARHRHSSSATYTVLRMSGPNASTAITELSIKSDDTLAIGSNVATDVINPAQDIHLWFEYEAGTAIRAYWSYDGVKPLISNTARAIEFSGTKPSTGVFHVSMVTPDLGIFDDFIVSSSPLGDNPFPLESIGTLTTDTITIGP